MKSAIKLILSVPFIISLPSALLAAPSAPVEIVQDTSSATEVDSALSNSMESQSSAEKKSKYSKPFASKQSIGKSQAAPDESAANEEPEKRVTDADYTIRAGDVLQITVWKEENLDREVLVLPDGTIDFPLIGSFPAQGLTTAQLQTSIKSKLRPLIPGASVAVLVKAPLGHSVSVIGQVTKPGEIIAGHNLTVMQALSQAGGLTPYASQGRIKILRTVDGKETAIEFPYNDVVYGDNLDKDIILKPGDVVVVPTASLF